MVPWLVLLAIVLAGCGQIDLTVASRQDAGVSAEASVDSGGDDVCPDGVLAFATGDDHICAINAQGVLRCGGQNDYGQLGDGTTSPSSLWRTVSIDRPVQAVAAGNDHSCALDQQGALWCWGRNDLGQLGDQSATDSLTPKQVSVGPFVIVSTRFDSTCAIRRDGALVCWGDNTAGQLGVGDLETRDSPAQVDDAGWSQVSLGRTHACGIKEGSLHCWGGNDGDQLGIPGSQGEVLPRLVSEGWRSVSSGERHSCGIRDDGTLFCWGDNSFGQLGIGDTEDRDAPTEVGQGWTAVATGRLHSCGVRSGQVFCWGTGLALGGVSASAQGVTPQPLQLGALPLGAENVASADELLCASTSSKLVCWGENNNGELGLGTTSETEPPVLRCP